MNVKSILHAFVISVTDCWVVLLLLLSLYCIDLFSYKAASVFIINLFTYLLTYLPQIFSVMIVVVVVVVVSDDDVDDNDDNVGDDGNLCVCCSVWRKFYTRTMKRTRHPGNKTALGQHYTISGHNFSVLTSAPVKFVYCCMLSLQNRPLNCKLTQIRIFCPLMLLSVHRLSVNLFINSAALYFYKCLIKIFFRRW